MLIRTAEAAFLMAFLKLAAGSTSYPKTKVSVTTTIATTMERATMIKQTRLLKQKKTTIPRTRVRCRQESTISRKVAHSSMASRVIKVTNLWMHHFARAVTWSSLSQIPKILHLARSYPWEFSSNRLLLTQSASRWVCPRRMFQVLLIRNSPQLVSSCYYFYPQLLVKCYDDA